MHNEPYRNLLQQKAEELKRSLWRRGEMAAERAPDELDDTVLAAQRESAVHDLERTYRLLRQVELALARLDAGRYGSCLKCEEKISEKRLNAVPWALYCIDCQEQVDRLQAQLGALRRPAA